MNRTVLFPFFFLLGSLIMCSCAAKGVPNETDLVNDTDTDAISAYHDGHPMKALEIYKALLASNKDNHRYMNNIGVMLLENGQADEALRMFEGAAMRAPDNADYLVNIGFAHSMLGEIDKAMSFFERANRAAPHHALAYFGKGVVALEREEPETALGAFHITLEIAPEDPANLFMKAYAEQKNDLWTDAIDDYTAYLARGGDKLQMGNAYSNRALCQFRLGRYDQGMTDLQQALEHDDSNAVYYYNRAMGHQLSQHYESAIDDYTRAISRKVDFPEAYINRGEMRFLIDNDIAGCEDLRKACSLGICEGLERYEAAKKCE